MITGQPAIAAFCTISTETRLVSTMAPAAGVLAGTRERADQLVERVVAADVFARQHQPFTGPQEPRRMDRAGLVVQRLVDLRARPWRAGDLGAA